MTNKTIKTPYGEVDMKNVKLTSYMEGSYIVATLMDKAYYFDGTIKDISKELKKAETEYEESTR